ncbi:hypothetical protein ITP53_52645 [Nonomuraea sp. K274]|uniref:Uncharacterized protein n=1 Tax=Nonomuraea cypriaca TaxID=1187855 RepID=A0A931F5Z8_9ACTN|nr:hypothetical protein [Nonomuraea cypriaca]MBF8194182.1 hypothetical protein [Nonomuraea cypriaca]
MAVGVTVMVIVGTSRGAPAVMVVEWAALASTLTGVAGIGVPLGLMVPPATKVLVGGIAAGAVNPPVVGCLMSHFTVAVALGETVPACRSMVNVTVDEDPPVPVEHV